MTRLLLVIICLVFLALHGARQDFRGCAFSSSPCTQGEERGGVSLIALACSKDHQGQSPPHPSPPPEYQGREKEAAPHRIAPQAIVLLAAVSPTPANDFAQTVESIPAANSCGATPRDDKNAGQLRPAGAGGRKKSTGKTSLDGNDALFILMDIDLSPGKLRRPKSHQDQQRSVCAVISRRWPDFPLDEQSRIVREGTNLPGFWRRPGRAATFPATPGGRCAKKRWRCGRWPMWAGAEFALASGTGKPFPRVAIIAHRRREARTGFGGRCEVAGNVPEWVRQMKLHGVNRRRRCRV